MFKNYFKTAWRNILANKLFAGLNIAGLAIGLAVCILLFAYVSHEWHFDRMYPHANNIYRVNLQTGESLGFKKFTTIPNAVGPTLLENISQIKAATRLIKENFGATVSLRTQNKNFSEKRLYLADASIFKIFNFHFVKGDMQTVFARPHAIVLSQAAKKRLFGGQSAMGKAICVNNRDTFYVSGIYEDLPENSSIDCDIIYNIMDSWMGKEPWWSNPSYETYCLLSPQANRAIVEQQANKILYQHIGKDTIYYKHLFFQPFTKIHLYSSNLREGYASHLGDIKSVKVLFFLSLLVLLIGCINYMNLATARSQKRAKGVGISKVLGANSRQMLFSFYIETGLFSLVSILIGYAVALLVSPLFYTITGTHLSYADLYTTPILICLFFVWLFVPLIAGSYPALLLSRISPLVLMNKSGEKYAIGNIVRKGLVIFQFVASIMLIIAVVVILKQIHFMRSKYLGYNPDGIVALSIQSARKETAISRTINDLKQLPNIAHVSMVQSIPGANESGKSVYRSSKDQIGFPVWTCRTDASIVATMQLKLLAGTTLPSSIAKDDTVCYTLINEAVAKYLGFNTPQDAVGKYIKTEMAEKSIVSGVVKNFNYTSLKSEIGGYIYYKANRGEPIRTLLIRYKSPNLPKLIQQIQTVFAKDLPNTAFDYEFLDQHVQKLYASEQQTANTVTLFSILAIFVACLGLFGLTVFITEQRTKEIGIRKVLGASIRSILKIVSMDFLKLISISIIIAAPIAWMVMNKWLQNFAYRITVSWWILLAAGMLAIFIALITVSFQAIRAAKMNPVKSLRTE